VKEAGDVFRGAIGEERRAPFGTELGQRLHRKLAVALDQEREARAPVLLAELGEDLREIRRVLFLEEVDEIRRRAEPHQTADGVENDVNLALRHEIRPM